MSMTGSGAWARSGEASDASRNRREIMPARIPYNHALGMHWFRRSRWAVLLVASAAFAAGSDNYTPAERRYWAFQPRSSPTPPSVSSPADRQWILNPIDNFILASLRKQGLRPAPTASRCSLIPPG